MTQPGKLLDGRHLGWTGALLIAALLPGAGCSTTTNGTQRPSSPPGMFSAAGGNDEALQKRVEADKFPTAQQAGVASASSAQ